MANPNLLNLTSVTGHTERRMLNTTNVVTLINNTASGKLCKINTVVVANVGTIAPSSSVTVYVSAVAEVSVAIAHEIAVPNNSSLVVISKDMGIYIPEDGYLLIKAHTANQLSVICSYEELS